MERGLATNAPSAIEGSESLRIALRRFCVDCMTHDAGALAQAATVFGEENIVFGSDWPFDMGLPQPHVQLAGVTAQARHRLMMENARALLGAA
jgi:aminocarboxymuconate-semialdehyde decarboxylase